MGKKNKHGGTATQGFPKDFWGWKPIVRRQWLRGDAAQNAVDRGILHREDITRALKDLDKQLARVRRIAPTYERAEECERTGIAFPPPADSPSCRMRKATKMLNVSVEGKTLWPANYLTIEGTTYDRVVYEDFKMRKELGLDEHDDKYVTKSSVVHYESSANPFDFDKNTGVNSGNEEYGVRRVSDMADASNGAVVLEWKLKEDRTGHLATQIGRYIEGRRTNLMGNEGQDVARLHLGGNYKK